MHHRQWYGILTCISWLNVKNVTHNHILKQISKQKLVCLYADEQVEKNKSIWDHHRFDFVKFVFNFFDIFWIMCTETDVLGNDNRFKSKEKK